MNAIAWALNSVRNRGLAQTMTVAASVVADLAFDWRHGTSTMRWVDVHDLIAKTGIFREQFHRNIGGTQFRVYANR